MRNIQLVADLRGTIATLSAHQRAVESLNDRLLRTQEEERALLAADLHDEPLQTALDIERQLAAAEQTPATVRHQARVRALIVQIRALCITDAPCRAGRAGPARGARPAGPRPGRARHGIVIELSPITELDGARLTARDGAGALPRRAGGAAQRAAARHACRIWITLRAGCDELQLRVSDDGVGFSVPGNFDHLANGGHLGLAGLSYRVRQAGGQLTLRSTPGQGTVVGVDMPFEGRYPMIRMLLVDDHMLMRQGTRTLLEEDPEIVIVGEAAQGEEALLLAAASAAGCGAARHPADRAQWRGGGAQAARAICPRSRC